MKKTIISFIFILSLLVSAAFGLSAQTMDWEGYPVVYLRGDFASNWNPDEAYRFTRKGDVYTLTINSRNAIGKSQFKIADDNWSLCNLGANSENVEVNSTQNIQAAYGGPNFKTDGISSAVISFTYTERSEAIISFVIDDVTVEPEPEPEPDNGPKIYLRGGFNSTGWAAKEQYRFSRDGNKYTLVIDSSNAIGECEFKIGDENWENCDLGAFEKGYEINSSCYVDAMFSGSNFKTAGLSDAVISFVYEPLSGATISFVINGAEVGPRPVTGLSGTLPVLYINVYADEDHTILNNEIINKDLSHKNYFDYAEYWLDVNGCEWLEKLGAKNVGSKEEPLKLQIKARGNWTRIGFSKKPFKLKLDKKQSLLGLTKSKHFAILAHADDNKGYLRNFVGFNLGKRIGLPWTPSQQPVEVVINGDYRGLYFLTESIRVDEDRVNIQELDDNVSDNELISGGYIVELDNYDEDDSAQIRMDEKTFVRGHNIDRLRITFDTPEVYSDLQRQFITEQFTYMNNYVGANSDELWKYMDLDDAARYYIVEEIVSHTESYHGSTYLFRDRGEGNKWHFSPLWDFGNAFNGYTNDYFYNCDPFGNTWIPSMRENSTFNSKVKATWLWFMSNCFDGIIDDIDEYVAHISSAAKADHAKWKTQPVPSGGHSVYDNSDMQARRNEVVGHLNEKTAWLIRQFGDYTVSTFAEPERDNTPAAPLPAYAVAGIENVETGDSNAPAEYYNMQGMRVDKPRHGTYIRVQGSKVSKVLVR